jgi:hypothetical protein
VVGSCLDHGARALEAGTAVKLARAPWIVPLVRLLGRWKNRGAAGTKTPRSWVFSGFQRMAAAVVRMPPLRPGGRVVAAGARQAMVLTLLPEGAGHSRDALRQAGPWPFVLGIFPWIAVSLVAPGAVPIGLAGRSEQCSHFEKLVPRNDTG